MSPVPRSAIVAGSGVNAVGTPVASPSSPKMALSKSQSLLVYPTSSQPNSGRPVVPGTGGPWPLFPPTPPAAGQKARCEKPEPVEGWPSALVFRCGSPEKNQL